MMLAFALELDKSRNQLVVNRKATGLLSYILTQSTNVRMTVALTAAGSVTSKRLDIEVCW